MAESRSYLVVVSVRDPHGGATSYWNERIIAQSAKQAAKIAKGRHVGGRFTANYVSTRVVG